MKSLTQFLEAQKFLVKGHTKDQSDAIDLDLPSGTKWATCNIGANKPEEPGLYFQWGRIDGYKYGDRNHKFFRKRHISTSGTKYNGGDTLKSEDDAAYQATKGKFRTPTKEEIRELFGNTWHERTELNGVEGSTLISKKDKSKWIFIPHAGRYDVHDDSFCHDNYGFVWTSTAHTGMDECAYHYWFCGGTGQGESDCRDGLSIRGVLNK